MIDLNKYCMLVSLKTGMVGAKKKARDLEAEYDATHQTRGAVNASKVLVAPEYLAKLVSLRGQAANLNASMTLPWLVEGQRILSHGNALLYSEKMGAIRDAFLTERNQLVERWDEVMEDSRHRLNGLFNPAEMPTAEDVLNSTNMEWHFFPMPQADHWIGNIAEAEMRAKTDELMVIAKAQAEQAVYMRIKEAFDKIANALKNKTENNGRLYRSHFEAAGELAEILREYHPEGEQVNSLLEGLDTLSGEDVDSLKSDRNYAMSVRDKAERMANLAANMLSVAS